MPKYVYHCKECNGNFETVHGMTERQDHCDICSSSSCLSRIPQMPYIKSFNSEEYDGSGSTPEQRIKEAIEENTKILKDQKKRASSLEWKEDV